MLTFKYCVKCDKKFMPVNNTQKFCQDPCSARSTRKTIAELNEGWINRKPRKMNYIKKWKTWA
jgi:hypothetical protein